MDLGETQMSIAEGFKEFGRIVNAYFPAAPDQGYVGQRSGWYPEKPRRKKRKSA